MRILIRVYKYCIRVQIGHGEIMTFNNWKSIFPIIESDDDLMIQDFTNTSTDWVTFEDVSDMMERGVI